MALPVQRIKQTMAQPLVCSQAGKIMFPSSAMHPFFLPSSFSVFHIPQPAQGRMNYLLTGFTAFIHRFSISTLLGAWPAALGWKEEIGKSEHKADVNQIGKS